MSESKTPITDSCENTDGSIRGNDELIETCRRFESELQAAKSTASKAMHDYETAVMEIAEWRTVFGDIADAASKWDAMNAQIAELCGTDNYLLAVDLDKANAEIAAMKKKFFDLNREYGCELRDPNGTIWEHAATVTKELDQARLDIAALKATCDDYRVQACQPDNCRKHDEIAKLNHEKKLEELCSGSWRKIAMNLLENITKRNNLIEKFIKADTEESGCQCQVCCESRREWVKKELGK